MEKEMKGRPLTLRGGGCPQRGLDKLPQSRCLRACWTHLQIWAFILRVARSCEGCEALCGNRIFIGQENLAGSHWGEAG